MFNQALFTQYLGTSNALPLTLGHTHYFFKSFQITFPDHFPVIHTIHSLRIRPFKISTEENSFLLAPLTFDIEYISKTITHIIHSYTYSTHVTQLIPSTFTHKKIHLSCINLYASPISSNSLYISAFFILY